MILDVPFSSTEYDGFNFLLRLNFQSFIKDWTSGEKQSLVHAYLSREKSFFFKRVILNCFCSLSTTLPFTKLIPGNQYSLMMTVRSMGPKPLKRRYNYTDSTCPAKVISMIEAYSTLREFSVLTLTIGNEAYVSNKSIVVYRQTFIH